MSDPPYGEVAKSTSTYGPLTHIGYQNLLEFGSIQFNYYEKKTNKKYETATHDQC